MPPRKRAGTRPPRPERRANDQISRNDPCPCGRHTLKALSRNIDTSTPEGRLFFHVTAAFDRFQRELIVENSRAGLKAANKRGRRGGRPRAMDERTLKHAEAMRKDTENYPFVGDVIDQLEIGRSAFYRYFPPDRIKQLRKEHADGGHP